MVKFTSRFPFCLLFCVYFSSFKIPRVSSDTLILVLTVDLYFVNMHFLEAIWALTKTPYHLLYVGDCTIQLYRDYTKLLMNPLVKWNIIRVLEVARLKWATTHFIHQEYYQRMKCAAPNFRSLQDHMKQPILWRHTRQVQYTKNDVAVCQRVTSFRLPWFCWVSILLMEEIQHHLWCIKTLSIMG